MVGLFFTMSSLSSSETQPHNSVQSSIAMICVNCFQDTIDDSCLMRESKIIKVSHLKKY